MALKKEKGIVIESMDFGESDRVFSLIGESQIRQKFISKGIRKSKRRPIASTELGSLVEIDFYDEPTKEWKSIKEIHLLNRFDSTKSSYLGTLSIMYFTEYLSMLYPEGESHPFLFQLLEGTLQTLETDGNLLTLLPFFKLRALAHLGHFPSEFYCSSCGEEVLHKMAAYFSLDQREFICGNCHSLPKNQIHLIQLMRIFLSKRFSHLQGLSIEPEHLKELDQIMNQFFRLVTGKEMKSYFEFYKSLGNS
ncbi:DNA repair protein RecO [Leptospira ryugenii]|uniref:DNA repair protein RecO n=1 Tax=Leptospira ryugenii TaxID=1917863 RepID=A0A2P2DVU3_9LEPT|nr:DNA repair protein RecO [Leptospira ryugenii]GBF48743.1 DNA repair protein RecO [Leptospira ryugenii]